MVRTIEQLANVPFSQMSDEEFKQWEAKEDVDSNKESEDRCNRMGTEL